MTAYTIEIEDQPICAFDADDALHAATLNGADWFISNLLNLNNSIGGHLWGEKRSNLKVRLALPDEAAAFQHCLLGHVSDVETEDWEAGELVCYFVTPTDDAEQFDDVCVECRLVSH